MPRLTPSSKFTENTGQGWHSCVLCGTLFNRVEIPFNDGGVEPTVGETVTGGTSGDTGVLEEVVVYGGTWGAGDATGVLVLKNYTGASEGLWGQDAENLNGSTAGNNFATTTSVGAVKKSGMMYPTNRMVRIDGKRYCATHAKMVSSAEQLDLSKYVPEEISDES